MVVGASVRDHDDRAQPNGNAGYYSERQSEQADGNSLRNTANVLDQVRGFVTRDDQKISDLGGMGSTN